MNLLVTNLKLFSSYCKKNTRKILQFENEIYIYIYIVTLALQLCVDLIKEKV